MHSYFLFGFDNNKSIFNSFSYLEDGNLQEIEIGYDDFYTAAIDHNINRIRFNFYCLNQNHNYDCFDINKFVFEVNRYINSEDINNEGLNAVNRLKTELFSFQNTKELFDISKVYIFYEHKFLMLQRLKYMCSENIIEDRSISDQFEAIMQECAVMKSLINKYNITHDFRTIEKIVLYIEQITEKELSLLKQALENITL